MANLQNVEIAIKADERLDEIAVLLRNELFGDAKDLIEDVRDVYFKLGLSEDNERITKTSKMLELVDYGVKYYDTVAHKQFEESKEHIQKCKDVPAAVQPPTDLTSKLDKLQDDYETDEFDTSLESSYQKTDPPAPTVVPDGGLEVEDATNDVDVRKVDEEKKDDETGDKYENEEFESSLESSQQTANPPAPQM